MALQTANQFRLSPNIGQSISEGLAQGQQFRTAAFDERDRAAAREKASRVSQFSGPALAGDPQALESIAQDDIKLATAMQGFLATKSKAEQDAILQDNRVITKIAQFSKTLGRDQLRGFVQSERDRINQSGTPTPNLDRALSGTDEQLASAMEFQAFQGQKVEDIAKQQFAQPKRTALQENLIAAGLQPGTPEFESALLKAVQKPATQISIGGEKKFQEKLAEGQAKTVGRITEEADAAIDANQSLSVLEAIDVDTGALEPAKQGLAVFAQAFGLNAEGIANVSKGEAFNAEAKRLVLAVKASQKGPQTDRDELTIRQTVANLGNTKAGNQFIIDSARALNNRRIERKEFYDQFIEDAGGNFKDSSGQTADRAWSKFKRQTPMISSNLRTPEGLPVFFYRFEEAVRDANPDATKPEIMQAWRDANRGKK